jgi:ubiquinone/menaquinone biosynthesis C-methylase UbiE
MTGDPLAPLKAGAKVMWGMGDYRPFARILFPEAEALVRACGVGSGTKVLDVAAGTGNFSAAAARKGAIVVASDIAPQMIEWGKARIAVEGLDFEWHEADAEDLPFEDGRFDVVASTYGAMFAPRPDVVASEMFRVARPGGVVAMTNWTPEGYTGRSSAVISRHAPPYPSKLPSPTEWGDPAEVRRRFEGLAASIEFERHAAKFEFDALEEAVDFFMDNTGGLLMLKRLLPPERFLDVRADMEEAIRDFSRPDGNGLLLESEYLRVIARKP